jgi:hypothetical protein
MIAKRVTIKNGDRGSFARLAAYISAQHTQERVGEIRISNCNGSTIQDAVLEVQATQDRNRSRANKTYHLVISLAPGENPSPEVLRNLEDKLCASIDLDKHQRISVVHHDTDQVHIHVAANIIHPETYLQAPLKMDFRKLMAECVVLEDRYGLLATNHEPVKRERAPAQEIKPIEEIAQLSSYAKLACPDLTKAKSWDELHEMLATAGLTIEKRGGGFIIKADLASVKASSVDRGLSQAALVKRLGPYEPDTVKRPPPVTKFAGMAPDAVKKSKPLADLYRIYEEDKVATAAKRERFQQLAAEEKLAMLAQAKAVAAQKREAYEALPDGPVKNTLRANADADHQAALEAIRLRQATRTAQHRASLAQEPPTNWEKWLQHRATKGDPMALFALRQQKAGVFQADDEKSQWALELEAKAAAEAEEAAARALRPRTDWGAKISHVTSRGTVIYRLGESTIRDDGDRLHIRGKISDEAIIVALEMARERHGNLLSVDGSAEFRRRVAYLAAASAPDILFNDRFTDQHRDGRARALKEIANARGPEGNDERSTLNGERRGRMGAGDAPNGRDAQPRAGERYLTGEARNATAGFGRQLNGLPGVDGLRKSGGLRTISDLPSGGLGIQSPTGPTNPSRLGPDKPHTVESLTSPGGAAPAQEAKPPISSSRDGVRDLPPGDVVHEPRSPEVLAPQHVAGDLGDNKPGPNNLVRQPGEGNQRNPGQKSGLTPANTYIQEREEKRRNGLNMSQHVPYQPSSQPVTYLGQRNINGQPLALLGVESKVMVMPLNGAAMESANRLKVGDTVVVSNGVPRHSRKRGR